MKKVAFLSVFYLFLGLLALVSCGGGDDGISGTGQTSKDYSISGAALKGPYVKGSEVLIAKLLSNGQTSSSVTLSEINDDLGRFDFSITGEGPILISADGVHINEITGDLSKGRLNLKAIYHVSTEADSQQAYINVLTHLSYKRIQQLMSESVEIESAISQAESEVIESLQDVLPVSSITNFSQLNLYDISESNSNGNAYVLALSATLYQYAILKQQAEPESSVDSQLTWALNNLADDIAEDGDIDQTQVISDLVYATRLLNPTKIKTNLENRSFDVTAEKLPVANMDLYIDTDGDGQVNAVDDDDDNDGLPDESDARPYVYSEVPVITDPSANESLASNTEVDILWESSEHAKDYEFVLANDALFADIISSEVAEFPRATFTLESGKYYSRVRARNSLNYWGDWSETRILNVGIFTKLFGGDSRESHSSIKQTQDGGFIMVGTTESFDVDKSAIYLTKLDASGDEEWVRIFDSIKRDSGKDVIELASGDFVVSGLSGAGDSSYLKTWLNKVDSMGEDNWNKIIDKEINGKLLPIENGFILAAEVYEPEVPDYEYVNPKVTPKVTRFDSNGVEIWSHLFDGSVIDFEHIHGIDLDFDGNIEITGTYDSTVEYDVFGDSKSAYIYTLSPNGDEYSYINILKPVMYFNGRVYGKKLENGSVFVVAANHDETTYALYDRLGNKIWLEETSDQGSISHSNPITEIDNEELEIVTYSSKERIYGLYRSAYDFDGNQLSEELLIDHAYEGKAWSRVIPTFDDGYVLLNTNYTGDWAGDKSNISVMKTDLNGNTAEYLVTP